jgi:hypothetical protein
MKILVFVLLAATASAQIRPITIGSAIAGTSEIQPRPVHEKTSPSPSIATPILGYITGSGPGDIRPVLGTATAAHVGDLLPVPDGTARLYLPPKQLYALVERNSDESIAVWTLGSGAADRDGRQVVRLIPGALQRPTLVAFSPTGESAVLYSRDSHRLQVVGGLPFNASITRQLSTADLGGLSNITVTDDAALVFAGRGDGSLIFSFEGGPWQSWVAGFVPQAWTFVPNTHALVLSDVTQDLVLLLPNLCYTPDAPRILAQGIRADFLSVTGDGELLLAGSTTGKLWTIERKTGAVTSVASGTTVNSLFSLRAPGTFLLSSCPVSLLKLANSEEGPVVTIHSAAASQPPEARIDQ